MQSHIDTRFPGMSFYIIDKTQSPSDFHKVTKNIFHTTEQHL